MTSRYTNRYSVVYSSPIRSLIEEKSNNNFYIMNVYSFFALLTSNGSE